MKEVLIHLKKLDWILIVSTFLLIGIGLLSIYSSAIGRGNFLNFHKQLIFLGVGFLLMLGLSFIDWRRLKNESYLILIFYIFCLLALAGLFFFAPEIRGVRGWYRIGPISLDPIAPAKIILIILLAKYFSSRHAEIYRTKHIFLSGGYVLIPCFLIFLQPDFGSVMILIAIWLGILVISGIKLRHFLILAFCGLLIFSLSWQFLLLDYQKERIVNFAFPEADPLGGGWSQRQARIAIGAGGLFGQGIGQGSQTQYLFLPEPQTDFIFASIAEEMGLLGIAALFSLFLIFIWRILRIALFSQLNFTRLFAIGLVVLFISQAFIHLGVNLGLLPVIGISLPLVSAGGSGLIASCIGLGILHGLSAHERKYEIRQ